MSVKYRHYLFRLIVIRGNTHTGQLLDLIHLRVKLNRETLLIEVIYLFNNFILIYPYLFIFIYTYSHFTLNVIISFFTKFLLHLNLMPHVYLLQRNGRLTCHSLQLSPFTLYIGNEHSKRTYFWFYSHFLLVDP